MTKEGGTGGNVAALLVDGRKTASLNQTQLAERASVSRSRIIAAESRAALPTLELCLKLAHALGIPAVTMFRAHTRDYLGEANPLALAEIQPELSVRRSHWEEIADHHGLRMERGAIDSTVNDDGDLKLVRSYLGCVATRPRQRLVFRDRIIGERPPFFAIKGSPKGLDYSMNVSIEGEWAHHRVEFRRPWTAADGPFNLEFESTLPRAYVLDADEHNRRRAAEGLPRQRDFRSYCSTFVTYPIETLELAIAFPKSYPPRWCDPTATWGTAPPEDADYDEVHPRTCTSVRFEPGRNEARLILKRPAPGYLFGIHWQPPATWEPTETGEKK